MFKPIAAALTAALFSSAAFAGDPTTDAIEATVFDYFEGQGERSEERLYRAFDAENTRMVGVLAGEEGTEVRIWEMSEVLPNWASGDPSTDERIGKIVSMNVIDDRLAVVLFDSDGRFFDALTLAKVNNEWKIVSKVFVRQDEE